MVEPFSGERRKNGTGIIWRSHCVEDRRPHPGIIGRIFQNPGEGLSHPTLFPLCQFECSPEFTRGNIGGIGFRPTVPCSKILPFAKQPLGCDSMPPIGVLEKGDEFIRGRLTQPCRRTPFKLGRPDPIDSSTAGSAIEVEILLDTLGQRPGMFDHLSMHITDIETTVRPIAVGRGSKPIVRRSDEFVIMFVLGAPGRELDPVFNPRYHLAMHQVAPHIAGEGVVDILSPESVARVDGDTRSAGEIAGNPATTLDGATDHSGDSPPGSNDSPWLIGTDPIDRSGSSVHRDPRQGRGHRVPGTWFGPASFPHHCDEVIAVARHEPAAVGIKAETVLRTTVFGAEIQGEGIKGKVTSGEIDFFSALVTARANLSSLRSAGTPDPIVRPPFKAVGQSLDIET